VRVDFDFQNVTNRKCAALALDSVRKADERVFEREVGFRGDSDGALHGVKNVAENDVLHASGHEYLHCFLTLPAAKLTHFDEGMPISSSVLPTALRFAISTYETFSAHFLSVHSFDLLCNAKSRSCTDSSAAQADLPGLTHPARECTHVGAFPDLTPESSRQRGCAAELGCSVCSRAARPL
jgi:hypothetical protein